MNKREDFSITPRSDMHVTDWMIRYQAPIKSNDRTPVTPKFITPIVIDTGGIDTTEATVLAITEALNNHVANAAVFEEILNAARGVLDRWYATGGDVFNRPECKAAMCKLSDAIEKTRTEPNTQSASIEHPLTIADAIKDPQAALRQLLDDSRRLAFTKLAVKGAVDQWISTNGDAFDSPENTAAMRELRDAISKMQETAQ